MKKRFRNLSFIFVALAVLFATLPVNAEQTRNQENQTFTFDYSFKLRLGELTKNSDGTYDVPVIGYETTDYTTKLDLTGDDEIHYKVSEITEAQYNELKKYQDEIDILTANATADIVEDYKYDTPEAITNFQGLVRNGKDSNNNPWWCYNTYEVGTITLKADCETKYYIVTVDAAETTTTEMADLNWNYHTARVYKVDADTDSATCKPNEDTTQENNPKTGIDTPYIICGAIALVSVVVIISNKKKKYI